MYTAGADAPATPFHGTGPLITPSCFYFSGNAPNSPNVFYFVDVKSILPVFTGYTLHVVYTAGAGAPTTPFFHTRCMFPRFAMILLLVFTGYLSKDLYT